MNAEPRTDTSRTPRKAICYRCSCVVTQVDASRCPACSFPLIQEAGRGPEVAPTVDSLFQRVSVRVGAPPLPGVHESPRKAQLLMEARRRRVQRARTMERVERARTDARARRKSAATTWAFVSALAAGLVAAFWVTAAL